MASVTRKEAFIEALFDDSGLFDSVEGAPVAEAGVESLDATVNCSGDGVEVRITDNVCWSGTAVGRSSNICIESVVHDGGGSNPSLVEINSSIDWIPMEGFIVDNVIEAFIKYSEYARLVGFEIRFRSSELSPRAKKSLEAGGVEIPARKRTVRGIGRNWIHDGYEFCSKVRLQCVKGEKGRPNRLNSDRVLRTQATSCKAGVYLAKMSDGRWEFRKVNLVHNHDCDPNTTRFMRNYRIVSGVDEMQIVLGDMAGVTPAKAYMNFVVGHGGVGNVPFSLKDSHSVLRRWRMDGIENGDFNAMQKLFNEMKCSSDDFFYSYDTNVEGRLKNVLWVDGRSRAAYHDFGDVLCFDTTYLKNRYRMPLAPFIGVNHHGQSILLGCALLTNEDADSFKWTFETWLRCMQNSAPKYIMTDQCQAIGKAVAAVFPHSRHRWCLWHVMKNAELHLRRVEGWGELRKELSDVVHGACDADEFEELWSIIVIKHKLEENDWLKRMYDLREKWVPAYFLHEFWAGLHSTQRSEGMNNFFRSYVNVNTGLKQFAEQYCLALGKRVDDEEREDWRSKNKPAKCVTLFECEKVFQRCYTVRKFMEFQSEAKAVAYVNTERVDDDGRVRKHLVTDKCARKGLGRTGTKKFLVSYEADTNITVCTCKMFDFKGILCRHIVAVWKFEDVVELPAMYILDRWRKDRFRRSSIVSSGYHNQGFSKSDDASRCGRLQASMREITDLAMSHDEISVVVHQTLARLKEKCKNMLSASDDAIRTDSIGRHFRKGPAGAGKRMKVTSPSVDLILDPIDRRGKGRVPCHRKGAKSGGKRKHNKRKQVTCDTGRGGQQNIEAEGVYTDEVHVEGFPSTFRAQLESLRMEKGSRYHLFFS